jgi:hypothetical protein
MPNRIAAGIVEVSPPDSICSSAGHLLPGFSPGTASTFQATYKKRHGGEDEEAGTNIAEGKVEKCKHKTDQSKTAKAQGKF